LQKNIKFRKTSIPNNIAIVWFFAKNFP